MRNTRCPTHWINLIKHTVDNKRLPIIMCGVDFITMEADMIICFDCQPRTKRLLDELVASHAYGDYADVIATAVSNQALLHSTVGERGTLVIPEGGMPGASSGKRSRGGGAAGAVVGRTKQSSPTPSVEPPGAGTPAGSRIPDLFILDGLARAAVSPADPPDDVWIIGQAIPISRWLFGQYNKLLPAKASCRGLARLLTAAPDGVGLSAAAAQVAEAASYLGAYLAELDGIRGVSRDDALATAFPKTGDKSRLRFANQFVGSTNSHGQVSGLLMSLKLINRTPRKDLRVRLTDVGWKLALLTNPVLDVTGGPGVDRLSDEECALLLGHIATSVPAEDFAYRTVLQGISEGASTPDSLDSFLVRAVPDGAESLTKEFVATQRSGVVSRMADLGLIARVRDGVRVSYTAGVRAHKFLRTGAAK